MSSLAMVRPVDVRVAAKLHRFELAGFAALIVVLAITSVVEAFRLDATGFGANCSFITENPPSCEAMGRAFFDLQRTEVPMVHDLLAAMPFLFAALLGPPMVARELERGTARLAWSLAPSRVGWFVARLVPLLALVAGLSLMAGFALDRLSVAVEPGTDPWASFTGWGFRGVVLAARAVFVFAVGVVMGALVGRMLPALLLSVVLAYVGLAGGSHVHGLILAQEAVLVDEDTMLSTQGAMFFDQRLREPGGSVLTWDQFYSQYPDYGSDPNDAMPPEGWTMLALVVPGERFPVVAAREVGALLGGSAAAFAIAALAVHRRRPG